MSRGLKASFFVSNNYKNIYFFNKKLYNYNIDIVCNLYEVFIMENLKVAIGSDHGGFRYKESIIDYLKSRNIEYVDVGTYTPESCDYPVVARKVAEKLFQEK